MAWEGLTQELQAGGPNPPHPTLEVQTQTLAGAQETCVTTPSSVGSIPERRYTNVPLKLGFKSRTD